MAKVFKRGRYYYFRLSVNGRDTWKSTRKWRSQGIARKLRSTFSLRPRHPASKAALFSLGMFKIISEYIHIYIENRYMDIFGCRCGYS